MSSVPAMASTGVSVSSSGLSSVKTYTYQDSDEGFVVFTVTDPSRQATQISQCWVDGDGDLYECDVYPLRETDYRNGEWRIRWTPSGWEVRVYLGYYDVSEDECMDQFRGAAEYGIDIAVLGDYEEVLAEDRHEYELVCQGFAGETRGSKSITAYVGRSSTVIGIKLIAIDVAHEAVSARGCIYSKSTGRGTNCEALNMDSSRTSRGWSHAKRIGVKGVTARQCRNLRWNPGRFTYRVVFRDAQGDVVMEVGHDFRVTCR
jgi:hypothetical protein